MTPDLPAFRAWLTLHRDTVVGHCHNADTDPLACFLSHKLNRPVTVGDTHFVVGTYSHNHLRDQEEHPLPQWARDLVARLDALPRDHLPFDPESTRAVTGSEVLTLLDSTGPIPPKDHL